MKKLFITLLLMSFSSFIIAQEPACKISTLDSGGAYELSNGRVDIISKEVLDRIDSNGDPMLGFKISEHDSLSCESCIIKTKDSMFSSFTVYNCLNARVEMCDRLTNLSQSLRCSTVITKLQIKQCQKWIERADNFDRLVSINHLSDSSNGRCKMIQALYDQEHK